MYKIPGWAFKVLYVNMYIARYFWPKPVGVSSKVVPSEGIVLVNKEVKEVLEGDNLVLLPSGS